MQDVFLIENAGAEISMNNTVVANNQQDSSFTILDVSGGASATMTNSVIENNGQLQVSNERRLAIMISSMVLSTLNGFPDTFLSLSITLARMLSSSTQIQMV